MQFLIFIITLSLLNSNIKMNLIHKYQDNMLIIPVINIKTRIYESRDAKKLNLGIIRIHTSGTPVNNKIPMILAGHRYGFLSWTQKFRIHQSFYNLPKLHKNDFIYIIWQKHLYVYQVYKIEQSSEITDYNASVILYTCKNFYSSKRIIIYAR